MNLSVRELHIYVEQGLQRQGAYKKDKQFDQAVDIALTKAQDRVIKARLASIDKSGTFEINSKATSDVEAVIVLNYPILITRDANRPNLGYGVLPYNFAFLLGDSSLVLENCHKEFTVPTPTIPLTERVISIPFPQGTSSPYFNSITASVGNNSIIIPSPGFVTIDERVYLVDYIIDAFNSLGVNTYWETYKNINNPGCFLLITRDTTLACNIIVDNVSGTPTNIDTTISTYIDLSSVSTEVVNRDVKADYIKNLKQSIYHRSAPNSPISVLSNEQIFIYTDERFLVSKIFVDYIRKPKRISLALGQASELSDTLHIEIADLAIRLLKKQIEDDTYQLEVADTVKRVE